MILESRLPIDLPGAIALVPAVAAAAVAVQAVQVHLSMILHPMLCALRLQMLAASLMRFVV